VAGKLEALIDDLEEVIADRNIGERAAMLRRVTDMFLSASGRLSEEQIVLFDDVMVRLLAEIETWIRSAFGHLLATVAGASPNAGCFRIRQRPTNRSFIYISMEVM
jgi:uncharacterized protein (DUF2336 family)